jgi:pimeloyl-ACP methyl ester carboxylesterase
LSGAPTYRERGEGDTLILVPGLDGTALFFYRQVALLSRSFHVVTFPLPDDPTCTMESLVSDLRALVDRVAAERGREKVILCGESFGGALSLSYALAHPQSLHGLVILNSFPYLRNRLSLRLGPRLLKAVPWGAMPLVRRFTESRLHTSHTLPEDLDEFHRLARAIGRQGYIRRLELLGSYDLRDRLHEIETPTLFLAADEDHLVPSVEEARFMTARMPNATMRVLPGYGHICVITHDFNLLELIDPWLEVSRPR